LLKAVNNYEATSKTRTRRPRQIWTAVPPSEASSKKPQAERDLSGVQEMMVFKPTLEEFQEPICYIEKLYKQGAWKYGCVKIIPPAGFSPPFSFDTASDNKLPFRTQILQDLSRGKVSHIINILL